MSRKNKDTPKADTTTGRMSVLPVLMLIVISGAAVKLAAGQGQDKTARDFAEVEILLNEEFNFEYICALPKAPGSDLEVLDSPKRVRVQLPADRLNGLIDQGAEIGVLKRFVLVEGSTNEAGSLNDFVITQGTCSGNYRGGQNGLDVQIPENGNWVCSGILISAAPPAATVTCMEVEYYVLHSREWGLLVDLVDADESCTHRLWNHEVGGHGFIYETESGITTCNAESVNQQWWLCAKNDDELGHGYIDYWLLKVYYGPPDNDDCLDAVPVEEGVPYEGKTIAATGVDESSCGLNDINDVWHSYTATDTHPVKISLGGSSFDTTLAVFASCGGEELACNDDSNESPQSEIMMGMTAATTYYIRIAGHNRATGDYILTISNPCVLPADFDHNCDVNFKDLADLALHWLKDEPPVNLAPPDSIIDFKDCAVLTGHWGGYEP